MNDFFELIYDAALTSRNEILADDNEYQYLLNQFTDLSGKYKKLELTDAQREIIDEMVHTEDLINEKETQAIYKKGLLDCMDIVKALQLIK